MKTAVFTIASKNYFAQVNTLMDSLEKNNPQWEPFVVLVDECSPNERRLIQGNRSYTLLLAEELPLPDFKKMFFRYTILELNTAVKPWAFEYLFGRGFDAVVYMDPDIRVYAPMTEINEFLQIEETIVLTPHITKPLSDDKKPTELNIMQGGVYNLGFLAVSNGPQIHGFIKWWENKLEYDCIVDIAGGLFVDQKWMDLVPSLFHKVVIFKHCGYNVAYWNLSTRDVSVKNGRYYYNGAPLVFFHFSGFNPLDIKTFSKHQNRYTIDEIGETKALAEQYAQEILNNNYEAICKLEYTFNYFDDGTKITDFMRRSYNRSKELIEQCGENPFADSSAICCMDPDTSIVMTNLMEELWSLRTDLQEVFPYHRGVNNLAYAAWFIETTPREYNLDKKYIQPVQKKLDELLRAKAEEQPAQTPSEMARRPNRFYCYLLRIGQKVKPFISRHCPPGLKRKLKSLYVKVMRKAYYVE